MVQIGGINRALAITGGKFLPGAALRGLALRQPGEPAAPCPSFSPLPPPISSSLLQPLCLAQALPPCLGAIWPGLVLTPDSTVFSPARLVRQVRPLYSLSVSLQQHPILAAPPPFPVSPWPAGEQGCGHLGMPRSRRQKPNPGVQGRRTVSSPQVRLDPLPLPHIQCP